MKIRRTGERLWVTNNAPELDWNQSRRYENTSPNVLLMLTSDQRHMLNSSAVFVVAFTAISACDTAFLQDVETRREATDRGCPAPNDGANDIAASVESGVGLTLTWTTNATNADSFVIERQSSREPTWGEIGVATALTFTDTRVLPNEQYRYRISALREAGGSTCATPASEPVVVRTVPAVADAFTARGTAVGAIRLEWDDPNLFEDGYRLTRNDGAGNVTVLGELAANSTALADSGVTPGMIYTYTLVAFNASGDGAAASTSQRAVTPASLSWTTPPVIGPQCTLEVYGSATYDSGASFASSIGIINGTETPGTPTGFTGAIAPTTSGAVLTEWTVDDTAGGRASLSRTLEIVQTPTSRTRRRIAAPNELAGEGFQALQPTCADCGTTPPASISAAVDYTCQVKNNGRVACWGSNSTNQLGHGDVTQSYVAVRPCALDGSGVCAGAPLELANVDAREDTACGITSEGRAVCWGSAGSYEMLGRSDITESFAAVPICPNGDCSALSGVTQIAVGNSAVCAVAAGNQVWCWGRDVFTLSTQSPQPVCESGTYPGCTVFTADQVDVGDDVACARRGGNVWCWGQNNNAIFGTDAVAESKYPRPVCVSGTGPGCTRLADTTDLKLGDDFACARKSAGTLVCWGSNGSGQLGTGSMAGN
ncbi:MAG: hypothetical protein H7Z43_03805, partial [Clostridia bacterium]|nr:hypothetical protein [Deltaproteobacteria bacterium]